jgi:DNA polymerase-1
LKSLQNHNHVRSKNLFLLDAYALIFRGYYAFIKPRINSKGMDTSAIRIEFLMDVIKREKPDHLAVAFDNGGSQLRNEIFQNIKRTVMPPRRLLK